MSACQNYTNGRQILDYYDVHEPITRSLITSCLSHGGSWWRFTSMLQSYISFLHSFTGYEHFLFLFFFFFFFFFGGGGGGGGEGVDCAVGQETMIQKATMWWSANASKIMHRAWLYKRWVWNFRWICQKNKYYQQMNLCNTAIQLLQLPGHSFMHHCWCEAWGLLGAIQ